MSYVAAASALASAGAGAYASYRAGENSDDIRNLTDEQIRLSKAERYDAYGNRVYYDAATNSWRTELTPEQKALMLAGEREQRLGLTEDATRNRSTRARQEAMSRMAAGSYGADAAAYNNADVGSEEGTRSDIMRLIQQAQGTGDRALTTLVDRQALRQSGNMPVINTGTPKIDVGARYANAMLQARKQALEEYGMRNKQVSEKYLPKLQSEIAASGLGGDAKYGLPTINQEKAQEIAQAIAGVNQAYGSATGARNNAAGTEAKTNMNMANNFLKSGALVGKNMGKMQPSVAPIASGTSFDNSDDLDNFLQDYYERRRSGAGRSGDTTPWYSSTQSNPGDNSWY